MRIAMIPFGLLSGFMDSKEIRITELGEDGFRFRLAEECPEPEQFLICFYDMKKAGYRRVEIRRFGMSAAEEQCLQDQQPVEKKTGKYFYREYFVRVEQKDYVQEVRRLAGEYNRYILSLIHILRMRSWLSVLIADAMSKKRDDIPIAPSLYSLSNKMDNSLLAVRDINHKYIVVDCICR